jgi:hypothetical protein
MGPTRFTFCLRLLIISLGCLVLPAPGNTSSDIFVVARISVLYLSQLLDQLELRSRTASEMENCRGPNVPRLPAKMAHTTKRFYRISNTSSQVINY